MGAGTAATDAATLGQVQAGAYKYNTVGGTKNALTLSPTPAITDYAAGQEFIGVIGGTSSDDAVTLAVSGLATKAVEIDDAALDASTFLEANKIYKFLYDGTAFQATRVSINGLKYSDIGVTVQGYDADTAKIDVTQSWTGVQRSAFTTDNDGSFDMNAAQNFDWTPTGADTLEFTNETAGQSGLIFLDNTSNYTISFGSEVLIDADAASVLSVTGKYIIGYSCEDGTNVMVTYSQGLV